MAEGGISTETLEAKTPVIKSSRSQDSRLQQLRDTLKEKLKETRKGQRKEALDNAKETPEYWQARTGKIKERQDEEEIDDGLGVFVRRKTLYHGSATSGIRQFNKAEEFTVGTGIYLTSEAKDAIGYARVRSWGKPLEVIYESSIENMKLLDLRKDENVHKVLEGFKPKLAEKLEDQNLKLTSRSILKEAIEAVDSGKVGAGNLRDVTAVGTGKMFTDFVESLGYEGLITFEGGEGPERRNHDTYLVFDPEKVTINKEQKIALLAAAA